MRTKRNTGENTIQRRWKYSLSSKKTFVLLGVLVITFVSLYPVLNNEFVRNWDDKIFLVENPSIQSLDLKHIFTNTIFFVYVPLTILSFAIEHHFFGYNPFIYHLDNLLLHLTVTSLIFFFALQIGLTVRASGLAALLFGVHPLHVESVAWVAERKDVLYSVFYVGALCFYWQYLQEKKIKSYLLSIIFGVLSILSKPMALTLPLILFLCDWLKGRKFEKKVLLEKIPYFLYIIPIAWITYSFHTRIPGNNFVEGALIWVWTLIFYIRKFVFPFVVVPLYLLPSPISIYNYHYLLSICILGLLLIYIFRYRKNRWLIFAVLFYFGSIFFLLKYDDFETVIVADRYMYLPSLGMCVFFGFLCDRILEKFNKRNIILKRIGYLGLIVLFLAMCFKSSFQTGVWKNSVTLWDCIIRHSFDHSIAYVQRGIGYAELGKYDLAVTDFNKALEIDPTQAAAYGGRGAIYTEQGKYALAFEDYNRAIAVDPQYAFAYVKRGIMYSQLGEYALALKDFDKALEIDPQCIIAHKSRSDVYAILSAYEQRKRIQE